LVHDPAYRCAWVATRIIGTEVPARPDRPDGALGVLLVTVSTRLGVPWIYEFVAVGSKRQPTITDLVKSLPLVARVVL
jgi:hypothetical protein